MFHTSLIVTFQQSYKSGYGFSSGWIQKSKSGTASSIILSTTSFENSQIQVQHK